MRKIKSQIALVVKSLCYQMGIDAMKRSLLPSSVPVIIRYHSVCSDSKLISSGIRLTPEAFKEHVGYFAKYFHVITMTHLIEHLQNQQPFHKNTLVLTFDDGYADNLDAAKVLSDYGLTGLFYITAGCIESDESFWVAEVRHLIEKTGKNEMTLPFPNEACCLAVSNAAEREQAIRKVTKLLKSVTMEKREHIRKSLSLELNDAPPFPEGLMLNWSQLREMVQMGMEIGGHTLTHPNLPSATIDEAHAEIFGCKSLLETQLQTEIVHFAYPNGGALAHFDEKSKVLLREAGFKSATTSKAGKPGYESDLFELRRMRSTEALAEMLWDM